MKRTGRLLQVKKMLEIEEHKKDSLLCRLQEINQNIDDLKKEEWSINTGMKIGDDVLVRKVKKGQIVELSAKHSWITPIIAYYNKNGKLGKRTEKIFIDDLIEPYEKD